MKSLTGKVVWCSALFLVWITLLGMTGTQKSPALPPVRVLASDSIRPFPKNWTVHGSKVSADVLSRVPVLHTEGDAQVFWNASDDKTKKLRDVIVEGDVSVSHIGTSSGFIVRAGKQAVGTDSGGYYACLRPLATGYAVVQLFRFPDFVLLQEARLRGTVGVNQRIRLKVICKGPHFWVWAGDTKTPAITEFDDTNMAPGFVGLKADNNQATFANLIISTAGETPRPPYVHDWSKVKGAVFITSESVNSYQMWEQYHPQVVERELSYARKSGLTTVQVYLQFLVWQKNKAAYLAHIEDFLKRADKQGLKTTFIFFDDVGNIEPPHLAPYADPIPGIHNSQMQGSPGRDIVDNRYNAYRTQLKKYVQSIVTLHKHDARVLFWQTYNEPSHVTTLPLLADSYRWIKETGSRIPVTATGGGAFYGSYYSDFPSFHSYLDSNASPEQSMVLGDGGAEHLCTETLDRPGVDVPKLVNYFGKRKTGWILWELMIGRDNCRFPWGSLLNAPEPDVPFHGLVYPDGHPWSEADIKAIRGSK